VKLSGAEVVRIRRVTHRAVGVQHRAAVQRRAQGDDRQRAAVDVAVVGYQVQYTAVSSGVVAVSSTAIGASLTGVIEMLTVATLAESAWPSFVR
jgi:hypothetical protein